MIAIIDNYDSFTYNLFQFIGAVDPDIRVFRNDCVTPEELRQLAPDAIVLSPGPGRPADAGVCIDVVLQLGAEIPVLGVCLGHQAICEAFGATVTYAKQLMHGKQSVVDVNTECPLFTGLDQQVKVARYHSLAADESTMPECLQVTARTDDGEIMAVQHADRPIFGVQFHPESIMTPDGMQMIENFLAFAKYR